MDEQVIAYLEYLSALKEITRPAMPHFDLSAYNDNEYKAAIDEILKDYEGVDDFSVTLRYLKGE